MLGASGPAAAAGVSPGDVITHIDGRRVRSNSQLQALIGTNPPGARITLTLQRPEPAPGADAQPGLSPTYTMLQLAVVLDDSLRFTGG